MELPRPVRQLIARIATPCSHHREDEVPALAEEALISTRVEGADFFRHVREVEFDRPAAARLEVDEHRPVFGAYQVAWVRLAMEELLCSGPDTNPSPRPSQVVDEKLPVPVSQRWRAVPAGYKQLSLTHSIHEVWCRDIESAHPGVKS